MFWKKNENQLNSKEYESLVKKFIEITGDLEEIKAKYKMLVTDVENLRGRINAKLGGKKKDEEETKGLYNSVLLRDNGEFSV